MCTIDSVRLVQTSRAKKHDKLHAPDIDEPYGPQRVNGSGHTKKGPLGQESETYKRKHLESSKGIKFIYHEQCIFHLSLLQSALEISLVIFL